MAIGKRIEKRLTELGMQRKDLMERVPNLSPQALSNLILRDSKRSEHDVAIAKALGMSVLELVYGEAPPATYAPARNVVALGADEPRSAAVKELIDIAESMNERGLYELIGQARLLAQHHPRAKANRAS